jgi:hypothetical protein
MIPRPERSYSLTPSSSSSDFTWWLMADWLTWIFLAASEKLRHWIAQ